MAALRKVSALALAAAAGSARARVPVPNGQGCNVVMDRASCCMFTDGRVGTDYGGQDCSPAKEGTFFATGTEGSVCQPSCWASGTCGDGVDQSQRVGTCAAGPQSWYLLGAGRACRADVDDLSIDGRGTAIKLEGVSDMALCKTICTQSSVCSGVEFAVEDGVCEIWTRPIGFTVDAPGYECWGLMRRASAAAPAPTPAPTPAPLPGFVDQGGAQIPAGGAVRFYAVGTSNAAWQTWPDQLHAMLRRLGYSVETEALAIPGALTQPAKSQVCADASTWSSLSTPRFGMIGWSSWGFAYDSKADCNAEGYRQIAGYNVSCTNAWACNPKWQGSVPELNVSALAEGMRNAHFVVLSNWINDAKTAQQSGPRRVCYQDADIDAIKSTDITAANLKRLIRAIHAQNPNIVVLVLARYADTRQIVYPNERTLPLVRELNEAVKQKVQGEPNTFFVDFSFPLGENMFQTLSKVHPNCRGDKVMATSTLEALFRHGILSRGLALDPVEDCLGESACSDLSVPCCQRSALCYVAADGQCAAYGPGEQ
mmetsp:Transcript_154326/g.374611  ORF Transcript_154326/g.374611 Transcript_154326/m.374611 type:complete len:539 (-) Transcript_154326:117-1733(-)